MHPISSHFRKDICDFYFPQNMFNRKKIDVRWIGSVDWNAVRCAHKTCHHLLTKHETKL